MNFARLNYKVPIPERRHTAEMFPDSTEFQEHPLQCITPLFNVGLREHLRPQIKPFEGVLPFSLSTIVFTASYPILCGSCTTSASITPAFTSASNPSLESKPTMCILPAIELDFNACDAPTDIGSADAKIPFRSGCAVIMFSVTDIAFARSDMAN